MRKLGRLEEGHTISEDDNTGDPFEDQGLGVRSLLASSIVVGEAVGWCTRRLWCGLGFQPPLRFLAGPPPGVPVGAIAASDAS